MLFRLVTLMTAERTIECDTREEAVDKAEAEEREANRHHHHGEVTTVRAVGPVLQEPDTLDPVETLTIAPVLIAAGVKCYPITVGGLPGTRPFKIQYAERVDGIDYSGFVCDSLWYGATGTRGPWKMGDMFSGFKWAGSGDIIGDLPFVLVVSNVTDQALPFAIRFIGRAAGLT